MGLQDEDYMREALRAAENARGRTSPNPLVGAVIVRENRIVAVGWHRAAGTSHAEIHALSMAGDLARGATLYVTLEPCAHYGRTGPCAKAVIEAGIHRVVVAMEDPNPAVSGRGIAMLRKAGIEVRCGVLEEAARRQNEVFIRWITAGRPFVWMKMAMSLDGRIATVGGESQWITGEEARRRGHEMRDEVDAILVGVGTVIADDPSLTARAATGAKNPCRIVLDSQARTPLSAKLLSDGAAPTIVAVTENAPLERVEALRQGGAEILRCGAGSRVDLPCLLSRLGERAVCSLLVEGGGTVHFSFLAAGLVDKVTAFVAPKFLGGRTALGAVAGDGFARLADAVELDEVEVKRLGEDVAWTGYVKQSEEAHGDVYRHR
ncbi:MAG: bifunctional diaminohydroxyphosphoribosylaminopyrimidine deaminase/5-amino-6-(5-phosphoribosylamino)uracil reductase RibD [Schwartzia sp. (in: firmicutes)]